jgi:hypothetical protein
MPGWIRFVVAILILGLTMTGGWVLAQSTQSQAPVIISGSDVGFRVDRQRTQDLGKLAGTWVVRFNGQWIEPETVVRSRPLSTR